MKLKKLTTILIAVAIVLSCAACAKNVKTTVDEASMETTSAECTEVVTETLTDTTSITDTSSITTTDTTVGTVQTSKQSTTKAKKQEIIKKSDIPFDKGSSGGSTNFTTTKVTTGTTAAPETRQSIYSIYKAAFDKTKALTSSESDIETRIKRNINGYGIDDEVFSGNCKQMRQGNNLAVMIQETQSIKDKVYNLSFYYENGQEYVSAYGGKSKFLSDPIYLENDATIPHFSDCFTEKEFEYAKSSASNGFTTITLYPDSNCANKIIGRTVDSSLKSGNNSISDSTVNITINSQGYIHSYQITCNIKEPVKSPEDGTQYELNMFVNMKITNKNIGQTVTVNPPSDLDTYRLIKRP